MNRVSTVIGGSVVIAALVASTPSVQAQSSAEASEACIEASRLIAEDDLVGALDEAEWCVESLRQLKQQKALSVFPDSVNGFTGGKIDNQGAMGITMIERAYSRDGETVSVALSGGIAGGGISALVQFASGMVGSGANKMRIQRRTVMDMGDQGGKAEFMVQLRSGGTLMIGSSDIGRDEVLEFVREFPIEELDESLTQ